MLDGLYFAGCLGLSSDDRLGLMLVLEALRDAHAATEVQQLTLTHAAAAPVEIASFLVPEMTRLARSDNVGVARGAVRALTETAARLGPQCEEAFKAWFDHLPLTDLLELAGQLTERAPHVAPAARPYAQDALDVAFAANLVADRAEELSSRDGALGAVESVGLALCAAGAFGRLAQLAAYRYLAVSDKAGSGAALAWDLLVKNGTGTASQPDLLRLAARLRFPLRHAAETNSIRLELTSCGWLEKLMRRRSLVLEDAERGFEALGVIPGRAIPVACAALWQSVLADVASEFAPELAHEALRGIWAPQSRSPLVVNRRDLEEMSHGFHHDLFAISAAQQPPKVQAAPGNQIPPSDQRRVWMWAASPFLQPGRGAAQAAPALTRGPAVLRLLSSAVVCARLLRAELPVERTNIPELFLHVAVAVRTRVLKPPRSGDDRLPVGQRTLVSFAAKLTDRIGEGVEPAIDPVLFYRRTAQRLAQDAMPSKDAARDARWILVEWLRRALPHAVAGASQERWLRDRDGGVPAEELLLDAVAERNEDTGNPTWTSTSAASLLSAYFPATPFDESAWDWRRIRFEPRLWHNLLIFNPRNLSDWARLADDVAAASSQAAASERAAQWRFASLAAEIGGFLSAAPGHERREWAERLRRELAAINSPADLPRLLRPRLLLVFEFAAADEEVEDILTEITLTLAESGLGSARDRLDLLLAVERAAVDSSQGNERWLALLAMLTVSRREPSSRSSALGNPWDGIVWARAERLLSERMRRAWFRAVRDLAQHVGGDASALLSRVDVPARGSRPVLAADEVGVSGLATLDLVLGAHDIQRDALATVRLRARTSDGKLTRAASILDFDDTGYTLNCGNGRVVSWRPGRRANLELGAYGLAEFSASSGLARDFRCAAGVDQGPYAIHHATLEIHPSDGREDARARLRVEDENIDLFALDDRDLLERWFADVLSLHSGHERREDLMVVAGDSGYEPVPRSSFSLLGRLAAEGPQRLTLISEEPAQDAQRAWRLSRGLSEHYVVTEADLHDGGAVFETLLTDHGTGVRVRVDAVEGDLDVRIVADPNSVDDGNCRWTSAFAAGDVVTVQRRGQAWIAQLRGLPPIRVIDLPSEIASTSEVQVRDWDLAGALRGSISGRRVPRRGIRMAGRPRDVLFEQLVGLACGDLLEVVHVMAPDRPTNTTRGWTSENLSVIVPVESVTLQPIPGSAMLPHALLHNRRAIVESINTRRVIGAVPLDKLSDSAAILLLAGSSRRGICGVVVARPRDEGDSVTVWVGDGSAVYECEVPVDDFETVPFVGDAVFLADEAGHLLVEVRRRLIHARLLWELAEPGDAVGPVGAGLSDGTRVQVHQATARAAVRVSPVAQGDPIADVDGRELDFRRLRIDDRATRGFPIAGSRGMWFRWRVRTPATGFMVGEVLDPLPGATVDRPRLLVSELEPGVFSIHREFLVSGTERRWPETREPDDPRGRDAQRWNDYLAAPRALSVTAAADHVSLQGMRVPDRSGTFVARVEVDDGPWIHGVPYPRQPAWAMLWAAEDGRAVASLRDVPAMTLADYAQFAGLIAGDWKELEQSLCFVRLEHARDGDEPVALFEFAYGGTLRVARSALLMQGEGLAGLFPLFHGDSVHRVRVVDGKLDLGSDITYSAARVLYMQAKHSRIVHVIDVVVRGHDRGRIKYVRAPALDHPERPVRSLLVDTGRVTPEALPAITERCRGAEAVTLYAKLRVADFETSLGETVHFDVLELGKPTNVPGVVTLKEDDRLLVEGGSMNETAAGNDVRLDLAPLSDVDPGFIRGRLRWFLLRRQFSIQENALRLQLEHFGPDSLVRNVFLARLDREDLFELLTVPPRNAQVLRSLLANQGAGLAIADGNNDDAMLGLEWEPGVRILLREGEYSGPRLSRGAVAQLTLNDGVVIVREAVPSEGSYVTRDGRTALLLPKNGLTHKLSPRNAFAVGGLPNVQVSVDGPDEASKYAQLVELLSSPHIPVATVARRGTGHVAQVADHPFGWVGIDDEAQSIKAELLEPGKDGPVEHPLQWGMVSFADVSRLELVERLTGGGWRLHDKQVFRLLGVEDGQPSVEWRDAPAGGPLRGQSGVVFGRSDGGELTLRHGERIHRMAFPPRVLLEAIDPRVATVHELVIARVDWRRMGDLESCRVYAEDAPGHLIELPSELWSVWAGDEAVPLGDFDWRGLGTGDRLSVRTRPLRPGELPFVELLEASASERGRLGSTFVLPMKRTADGGGLVLGAGSVELTHPDVVDVESGTAVLVSSDNALSVASDTPQGRFGALLVEHDGVLRIAGFEWLSARFLRSGVREHSWLAAALTSSPHLLLRACGGAVPVTVERRAGDVLDFSFRWQLDDLNRGAITFGHVAGRIEDDLIIRAGRRLLRLTVSAVVTGLPPAQHAAVADWLVAQQRSLWLHRRPNGRFVAGFRLADEVCGVTRAEITQSFAGIGVIAYRPEVGDLVWVAGERLAWARLTSSELAGLVETTEAIRDHQGDDVGLVGKATDPLLESLEIGRFVRVELIAPADERRGTAIARLLPSGIIAEAAVPATGSVGDVFLASVIQRRQAEHRRLVVLAPGGQPELPQLPDQLFAVLRSELRSHVDRRDPGAAVWTRPATREADAVREWAPDAMLARTSRPLDLRLALDVATQLAEWAQTGDEVATEVAIRALWGIGVRAAFSRSWEMTLLAVAQLRTAADLSAQRAVRLLRGMDAFTRLDLENSVVSLQRSVALRAMIGLAPSAQARQFASALSALMGRADDLLATDSLVADGPYALVSRFARAYAPSDGVFGVAEVGVQARLLLATCRGLADRVSFPPVLLPLGFDLPADYRKSSAYLLEQLCSRA